MTNLLVIGNGESRKKINLNEINCFKIGCNAIHRDNHVDILVCADLRMLRESLKNPKLNNTTIYTRKEWQERYTKISNVKQFPDLPYDGNKRYDEAWNWGSGPYAVLLAASITDTINLIGFDLYGENNKLNNVYKDTDNYGKSNDNYVDPSYWIYQIGTTMRLYKNCNFIFYNVSHWKLPKNWILPNVKLDTIENFVYKYNSGLQTLIPL